MSVTDEFRELPKCRFTANQTQYKRNALRRGWRATRQTFHQSINPEDRFRRNIYRITYRSILHHLSLSLSLTATMVFQEKDNVTVDFYGMILPLSGTPGLVLNRC